MGHCDGCRGAVEDSDLATCDLCKSRLCISCSTLTQTEMRAINVKKRKLLTYHCLRCTGTGSAGQSACSGADFAALSDLILTKLMERMEPLIANKFEDLCTRVDDNRSEIIMLRESNIQLMHLLSPSVTGSKYAPAPGRTVSENCRKDVDDGGVDGDAALPCSAASVTGDIRPTFVLPLSGSPAVADMQIVDAVTSCPMPIGAARRNVGRGRGKRGAQEARQQGTDERGTRKPGGMVVLGSAESGESGLAAVQVNPRHWFHLSRLSMDVSEDDVRKYISRKFELENCFCKKIAPKNSSNCTFSSFKVGIDAEKSGTFLSPGKWPKGVAVSRWTFLRGRSVNQVMP